MGYIVRTRNTLDFGEQPPQPAAAFVDGIAQTGVSLLAAEWTEPRWPRLGRIVAIAVGQLAVPLILLGSYATAAWGLTID